MQKAVLRLSGSVALCALILSVALLRETAAFAAASDPSPRIAVGAPPQETETQREARLIEGAKKEGKIVIWDAGAAKEWEQAFNKFRQKYPFVAIEHWRGDDAAI